jgi:hypothetical protein
VASKLLTYAVRVEERRAVEELLKSPGEDISVKATEIIRAVDAVRLNRPAYALIVQHRRPEGTGYDFSVYGPWATTKQALKAKPTIDNIHGAQNVRTASFTNCMNNLEETHE